MTPVRSTFKQPTSHAAVVAQSAGAGLILIAAFVPWVRSHAFFLQIPVRGVETDYGRVFPFLALGVFAVLAYQWSYGWQRWGAGLVLLIGAVSLAVAIVYGVQVKQRAIKANEATKKQPEQPLVLGGGTMFSVDFDVGFYLTLLGGGGVIGGAISDLAARRGESR